MSGSPGKPHVQQCRFRVYCDRARLVRLVVDFKDRASHVFSLEQRGPGLWETTLELPPGLYRFCYHLYDGRSLTYLVPDDCPMDGLKAVLRLRSGQVYETTAYGLPAPVDSAGAEADLYRPALAGGLEVIGPDAPTL